MDTLKILKAVLIGVSIFFVLFLSSLMVIKEKASQYSPIKLQLSEYEKYLFSDTNWTKEKIIEFISFVSEKHKVKNRALFIVKHESNFEPNKIGDDDKICPMTNKKQSSRGLWQISDCYNPQVSDICAYDIICSTNWAILRVKNNSNIWSVWRFRNEWYK